jgi:hypothetical protein
MISRSLKRRKDFKAVMLKDGPAVARTSVGAFPITRWYDKHLFPIVFIMQGFVLARPERSSHSAQGSRQAPAGGY